MDFKALLQPGGRAVVLWVVLMSGILALLREGLGLYYTATGNPLSASAALAIFGYCARAAFFLSVLLVVFSEHRRFPQPQRELGEAKRNELIPAPTPTVVTVAGRPTASGPPTPIKLAIAPWLPDGPRSYINEVSQDEVTKQIRALKWTAREAVIKSSYLNRWVRWRGRIIGIQEESDSFLLFTQHDKFGSPTRLSLPKEARHVVEPLHEGILIAFEGQLTRVWESSVFIRADPDSIAIISDVPAQP